MIELNNFYRNVTCFEEYDENSFIGRWLDYSEWNDKEYWKLEADLLKIADIYRIRGEVSQDVLIGIMNIIELLMIPNWEVFIVSDKKKTNIYDRYGRFKYIILMLFTKQAIKLDIHFYEKN